jgi:UDP-glucose 4-epimerase
MKLLVTGGAGYIGSVVGAHLIAAGHDVTVFDDLSTGHRDAVPPGATFVGCGIADVGSVLTRDAGFDGVLHFAARSLVGESVAEPALYWQNNVAGAQALLDAMRAAGVARLVFSSTAATYGEPDEVPIRESSATRPTSAYGASKLAVDLMIGGYAAAYGLAATSLRYFNVAGAWNGLGERHRVETHLIPIALEVAAGSREQLVIYGQDYPTADGTCVRDYIHVADLADAHLLALDAARPGHAVYNLGSGSGFSVRAVRDVVCEVTGCDITTVTSDRRAGDPAVLIASSERIRRELGWQPSRESLHRMVADAWEFARSRLVGGTGHGTAAGRPTIEGR